MNISIIVPVYNAETFLIKCLDSIFSQNFSGTFEVIAIDDASVDHSLNLLKNYQKKEVRLKIIEHEYNKKQAVARTTGMRSAKGDYIMHVDADDWLLPGTFEQLYNKCREFNPDVILFNYVSESMDGKRKTNELLKDKGLTTNKNSIQHCFYGNSATKFVRRNLTENMITGQETVNSIADDLLYCTEILLRAKSFYLLPETYYVVYINNQSLSRSTNAITVIQSMSAILKHLRKITIANQADTIIVNNVLCQIENNVFRLSLPFWLSRNRTNKFNLNELISSFKLFSEMTDKRVNQINIVLKKSKYAFYYAYKNFGIIYILKNVLGTLYYNVKFYFKKK